MQNHTSKPPKMGNTPRYIVETPNQLLSDDGKRVEVKS
jgi:hypothetical protein